MNGWYPGSFPDRADERGEGGAPTPGGARAPASLTLVKLTI